MDDGGSVFSWSLARSRAFRVCRRQYYYMYYGSQGGWQEGADATARHLYLLKKMTTLPMLVGAVVHRGISVAIQSASHGRAVSAGVLDHRVVQEFRAGWSASRRGDWRRDMRAVNLYEHYYEERPVDAYLLGLRDRMLSCMAGWHHTPGLEEARRCGSGAILCNERLVTFMVDDAPVWLRVDFAARAGSRVMLYDWKTGEPGEDDLFQLTVYALYMRQVAGVDVERLRVAGVYLQRRDVHSVVITDRMLESAQERIRSSVGEMRSCLEDEGENRAVPERFPMTDQERVCAACVFKEVCHPRDWRDLGG